MHDLFISIRNNIDEIVSIEDKAMRDHALGLTVTNEGGNEDALESIFLLWSLNIYDPPRVHYH